MKVSGATKSESIDVATRVVAEGNESSCQCVNVLLKKIVELISCMSSCWSFTSLSQNVAYLNSFPVLLSLKER